MNVETLKEQILNEVAKTGSCPLALSNLSISYANYRSIGKQDPNFFIEVKEAERFYIQGMNGAIAALSKKELLRVLKDGVTEVTMQTKTDERIYDDGERTYQNSQRTIKKTYKGVPLPAIALGLSIIPSIQKALETLIEENALDPSTLTRLIREDIAHEDKQREIISGESSEVNELSAEQISAVQRMIAGTVVPE